MKYKKGWDVGYSKYITLVTVGIVKGEYGLKFVL